MREVHSKDPHVSTKRERFDTVRGVTLLSFPDSWPKPNPVFGNEGAKLLCGHHVPKFVQGNGDHQPDNEDDQTDDEHDLKLLPRVARESEELCRASESPVLHRKDVSEGWLVDSLMLTQDGRNCFNNAVPGDLTF